MYEAGRYAAYTHKYRYVARLYNTEIYVCVFLPSLYQKRNYDLFLALNSYKYLFFVPSVL